MTNNNNFFKIIGVNATLLFAVLSVAAFVSHGKEVDCFNSQVDNGCMGGTVHKDCQYRDGVTNPVAYIPVHYCNGSNVPGETCGFHFTRAGKAPCGCFQALENNDSTYGTCAPSAHYGPGGKDGTNGN